MPTEHKEPFLQGSFSHEDASITCGGWIENLGDPLSQLIIKNGHVSNVRGIINLFWYMNDADGCGSKGNLRKELLSIGHAAAANTAEILVDAVQPSVNGPAEGKTRLPL